MASREEVLAEYYEAVAAPLSWTQADVAVGELGGQRVRFEPYTASIGQGTKVLRGTRVAVDLGGRVITTEIDNRKRTSLALPEVLTGDPEFDELFVVYGWPEQAIRNALEDETRRWLAESWPHGFPPVSVERRELAGRFGLFTGSSTPEKSVEEFRSFVDHLAAFGARLVESYDEERADEVRYRGEDGGRAWDEQLVALETKRAKRRATSRTIVFTGVAVLFVLIFVIVIVFGSGLFAT